MNKQNKQLYKTGGNQPDVDVKKYLENPNYTVVGLSRKGLKAMVLFYTLLCLFVGGTIFSYLGNKGGQRTVASISDYQMQKLKHFVGDIVTEKNRNHRKLTQEMLDGHNLKLSMQYKKFANDAGKLGSKIQNFRPSRSIASIPTPSSDVVAPSGKKIIKYSRAARATMRYEHDLKIERFKQKQKKELEQYLLTESNPKRIEDFRDKQKVALYGLKQEFMYKRIKFSRQKYLVD
jgi:hypothetical protein